MKLGFYLSMPNVNSWNGRWSGDGEFYAKMESFVGKKRIELAKEILSKGYFRHAFTDGWAAGITVKEIDSKEAARIRTKSKGFCAYDWMIKNIINYLSTKEPEKDETNATEKETTDNR